MRDNTTNMNKQKFIKFSFEKEETIDKMTDLFGLQGWWFYWKYLKKIIIKNNVSVMSIINVLNTFGSHDKIKIGKHQFIEFMCKKLTEGKSPENINDEIKSKKSNNSSCLGSRPVPLRRSNLLCPGD